MRAYAATSNKGLGTILESIGPAPPIIYPPEKFGLEKNV